MAATRLAPIAALALALPMVMALAACASPSCSTESSVKVVFDNAHVVDVTCTDGCDDSTTVERLGSSADRTWRFTFAGTAPTHLIIAGKNKAGGAIDRTRIAPEWVKEGGASCSAAYSDDVRVPNSGAS